MAVDRGTAAPLDSDRGGPRTTAADPAFLAAATATFLLLLVASEAASRAAARSGFWYRRVALAGTVTSLPELRERIRWAAAQAHPAFILGDSVLGASALLEHGIPDARRRTLSTFLAGFEARAGRHVESLAADGMLVPDIEALTRLLRDAPPRRAILLLNVRMFAAEFQDPRKSLSRDFLAAALPAAAGTPPRELEHRVPEWAFEHSALVRTTAMLKALWYFPTRRDFFRRAAERALGADADPEIQEAALRLKVASYYRDRWASSSAAFASLDRALRMLAASTHAVVVLTPQNPDFIEDAGALRTNRSLLEAFVRARGLAGIEYQDWVDRFAPDRFLDHCHLTAAGNREYAGDLARLLEE